jgi:PncC family amidohydrolase
VLDEIKKILTQRGQSLSCAESCTGGLVSAKIVSHPGVSSFYLGSVVAYSNSIKQNILQVPPELIKTVGAVSAPVALAMARGAKQVMGSTYAISTTGIAGPSGGSKEKPVGTVCFSLVGPGIEFSEQKLFSGDRNQIQEESVKHALQILLKNLKGE